MAGNSRRGFALMDPERQREIARKGGKAAHEKGTAHQFTPDEAREAGRKGGMVVSQHREHMVEIGRNGGRARRRRRSGDGDTTNPDNGNGSSSPDAAAATETETESSQPGSQQEMPDDSPDRTSYGAAHGHSARSEAESAPTSTRELATEDSEV